MNLVVSVADAPDARVVPAATPEVVKPEPVVMTSDTVIGSEVLFVSVTPWALKLPTVT